MGQITELSWEEAALIAASGFLTVFVILAILAVLIVGISKIVGKFEKKPVVVPAAPVEITPGSGVPAVYGGNVKLIGVDAKKAACIMAIVSEETGIALDQLVFQQIKALDEGDLA